MKKSLSGRIKIRLWLSVVLAVLLLGGCGGRHVTVDDTAVASLLAADTKDPAEAMQAVYMKNAEREASRAAATAEPEIIESEELNEETDGEDASHSHRSDESGYDYFASLEESIAAQEAAEATLASIEESASVAESIRASEEASIAVRESEEAVIRESEEEVARRIAEEEAARRAAEEEAARRAAEEAAQRAAAEEAARRAAEEEAARRAAAEEAARRASEEAAKPTDPTPAPPPAPPAPAYGKTILVGDSRTAEFLNTGLLPASQCFFYPGAVYALRDPQYGARIVDAANTHPAKAIFMNGMNDLGVYYGNAATFIAEYQATIDTFLSISPGTQIYCNAIIPPTPAAAAQYPGRENVAGYNAAIQSMCASRGWTYIDANGGFQSVWYLDDGIHFDWAWYPIWLGNFQSIVGGL